MPAQFDSFGLRFLYPDNWKALERGEEEGGDGVTFELPSGGFFSIDLELEGQLDEEILEEVATSIESDYDEVEREYLPTDASNETIVEYRFYYLDLLVVSRLLIMHLDVGTILVQMQAESRDFDENELVFAAILKQIRER